MVNARIQHGEHPADAVGLDDWSDLLSFLPSDAHIRALGKRGARLLEIDRAGGPVSLDHYPVRVTCLPRGVESPGELLRQLRVDLNGLVNSTFARFAPATADDARLWKSRAPCGALVHVEPSDEASLLCAEASEHHWRSCTVSTRQDQNQPLCGNREWGYHAAKGGGWIFYTRGVARVTRATTAPGLRLIFAGGHHLWTSFQRGLERVVNAGGGSATIEPPTRSRHRWSDVIAAGAFRPRRRVPRATPSDPRAISPTRGGFSLDERRLQVGDLVIATASEPESRGIQLVTSGPVSYAMIYFGTGLVIDASANGVRGRPMSDALMDASVAVAARCQQLDPSRAERLREFVGSQIGCRYGVGLVVSGSFTSRRSSGEVRVDLGRGRDDSFFCSQLVLAAYAAAGAPLTRKPLETVGPFAIAPIRLARPLDYLGHIMLDRERRAR